MKYSYASSTELFNPRNTCAEQRHHIGSRRKAAIPLIALCIRKVRNIPRNILIGLRDRIRELVLQYFIHQAAREEGEWRMRWRDYLVGMSRLKKSS